MIIAIFGATSTIAKDLISSFAKHTTHELHLFTRHTVELKNWMSQNLPSTQDCVAFEYSQFEPSLKIDAVFNFVGVGDPAQAKQLGSSIIEVTHHYDEIILRYLHANPVCKYVFMSSGAVYGDVFTSPVSSQTHGSYPVNALGEENWYSIAKLYAESRHRALCDNSIVDIRIFNYFSHTQNMRAKFFLTELVSCIFSGRVFKTTPANIVRDYITPPDFFRLAQSILDSGFCNMAVDCYSKKPIEKLELLTFLSEKFNLQYEFTTDIPTINATGRKEHYYSNNKAAAEIGYTPMLTSLDGILNEITLYKNSI